MAEQAGLAWPAFSAQHPGHGVDSFGVRQQVSGESSRSPGTPAQKRCARERGLPGPACARPSHPRTGRRLYMLFPCAAGRERGSSTHQWQPQHLRQHPQPVLRQQAGAGGQRIISAWEAPHRCGSATQALPQREGAGTLCMHCSPALHHQVAPLPTHAIQQQPSVPVQLVTVRHSDSASHSAVQLCCRRSVLQPWRLVTRPQTTWSRWI